MYICIHVYMYTCIYVYMYICFINHYPVCLLPCPYAKCGAQGVAQGAAHEQPQMEPQCMLKTHVGSEKGFTSGLGVHNQTWYETNLLSQVTQVCLDNMLERQCHTLSIVIEGHRPIGFWLEHGDFNDFME